MLKSVNEWNSDVMAIDLNFPTGTDYIPANTVRGSDEFLRIQRMDKLRHRMFAPQACAAPAAGYLSGGGDGAFENNTRGFSWMEWGFIMISYRGVVYTVRRTATRPQTTPPRAARGALHYSPVELRVGRYTDDKDGETSSL